MNANVHCCPAVQGKYLASDGGPKEARLNKYKGRYAEAESRYGPRPNVVAAVQAYTSVANQSGISPTALALRQVPQRIWAGSWGRGSRMMPDHHI